MDKYEINSKLYVKPTKNRLIVKFFLNIILFGISIFTLFRMGQNYNIIG